MSRRPTTTSAHAARAVLVGVLLVWGTVASGCSSAGRSEPTAVTPPITLPAALLPPAGGPGTPDATTTTSAPAATTGTGVEIAAFAVEAPLECGDAGFTATVRWRATGAVAATVLVDNTQVAGPVPVAEPFEIRLPCDGAAKTIQLVLVAADGSSELRNQVVLASPGR